MHQPSSASRLRERRAQLQRRAAASAAPRGSFVTGQPQFSFTPPQPAVSAFPLQPLDIPGALGFAANAFTAGSAEPARMGARSPEQADVRQRAATAAPESPRGGLSPGALLPQEECSERIDRLLQRVHRAQQSRREGLARMELASPRTPTRLDPPRRAQSPGSSGTVSTASIRSDSAHAAQAEPFSPRRRAATTGPSGEKAGARLAFGASPEPAPARAPIEEMRAKIERVRARRAARLKAEMSPSPPLSPACAQPAMARMRSEISGTTFYASDDDSDSDFFEACDNLMLFREMDVPIKDVDWDKRVYYHHVARTDERFRRAVEDVEIADCRDACLTALLRRREAACVLRGDGSGEAAMAGAFARPSRREAAAVLAWMDDESDVSSEGHSFEWTQDGFGYVEFRRQSRSSLASSSVMSPGRGLATPSRYEQRQPISTVIESPLQSALEWSVTSSTARAATANFSEAVAAPPGAEPAPRHRRGLFAFGARRAPADLAAVAEADEGAGLGSDSSSGSSSDDDWQLLGSGDEFGPAKPTSAAEEAALQQKRLDALREQNHDLRLHVQQARQAVALLAQMAIGASEHTASSTLQSPFT
ncbi:hypothetical protein IWW54_005678 [Coemansia sp. RSA 2705]|nr:hypothetical protein IWW54_005678 [Coemansia sp. RSA 2705]